MKLQLILPIFLILITLVYCQHYPSNSQIDTATTSITTGLDISSLINGFLNYEPVKQKIQNVISFIDLKIRLIRLANQLLTRENFILFRRVLELIVKVSNFFIQFLPENTEMPSATDLLSSIFPSVVTSVNVTQELPDKYGVPDQYGPPHISGSTVSSIQEEMSQSGAGNQAESESGESNAITGDRFNRSIQNFTVEDFNNLNNMTQEQVVNLANLIYRTDRK